MAEKLLGGNVSGGKGFRSVRMSQICPDSGISGIVQLPGYPGNDGFPIPESLDFLLAILGIPHTSMISGRFPHAKPFGNRNFPRETLRQNRTKRFRGKVSRGKCF